MFNTLIALSRESGWWSMV